MSLCRLSVSASMSKLTHIQAANIVKFALETGYRHIDAALIYGQCAYKGRWTNLSETNLSDFR